MVEVEERVSKLEETLVIFMNQTRLILAAIHEDIAEIRASNARTDRLLLEIQQQAERDRQQAEKNRQEAAMQAEEFRQQAEKDRQQAAVQAEEFRQQAEEFRQQAEKDRQQAAVQAEEFRQQADKDRQQAAMQAEEFRQQAEKDRQQAEEFRQQAEKDRRDFNRRLAEATDAQGLLIENMVWPNLKRIAKEVFRGNDALFQGIRIKRRLADDRSRLMELDLLAVGDSDVLVCEAKSKVTVEKVREFTQSLETFFDFFPEYAGKRLRPMVASVMIDPSVIAFMTSQRVLALGFGGETMDLLNPEALD